MSQYYLTGPAPSRPARRRLPWMLLVWPALGGPIVAASAVIALGFTSFAASGRVSNHGPGREKHEHHPSQ